eukprot:CAMPEP_0179242458 /NCGR_PEP_ID=MMETSP0797-20121207/17030_1 /TAXON_ID=47934 /ORGANISM="Dinophysis acuminata, Strain DAEP01" /LENGTH=75 /DNA_ID=CAMNT_0020949899 /DNA_START=92 /DNA_END=319 /DNA_ORIENTATION=+
MEMQRGVALFFLAFSAAWLAQGLNVFNGGTALQMIQNLLNLGASALALAAGIGLAADPRALLREAAGQFQGGQAS